MRIVEEIPHHTFKIGIYSMNQKFILKIELDRYEQTYKVQETDVSGVQEVRALLTDEFLESVMRRFLSMRTDFLKSFQTTANEN